KLAHAVGDAAKAMVPGISQGAHLAHEIGRLGDNSAVTAARQENLGGAVHSAARELNVQAASYEHAIGPIDAYIGATLTEYDDLHQLRVALRASGDAIGYKTQKERNSFAAARAYIDQTLKQGDAALAAHKGIDAQIASIQKALPVLEHVKGKTAEYRQELGLLKNILDRLRQEKLIQERVAVTGTGTWRIGTRPFPGQPVPT